MCLICDLYAMVYIKIQQQWSDFFCTKIQIENDDLVKKKLETF